MINRTIAPPIKNAVDFSLDLKPYEKFVLDNGIEVYSINAGEEEVVQLEWIFFAGNSWEDKNLVAAATNHLLKNGSSKRSAFDINEHFEFYGSYLNRHCYNETANITLHALSKHLPVLLPVVQELITDASFPETELEIFKQNSKQRLAVSLLKCDFVANRQIDVLLYGKDHPYGKYSSVPDYDALTTGQLKQFYDKHYRNGKCIIFVAGKLPADIFQLLNQNFGHLSLSKPDIIKPAANVETTLHAERTSTIINDVNGVQGAIRMASNFPNRHNPEFMEVQVLNTLFGGYFGSRLMSNIREEKGYTYGIHSYLASHFEQSAWMITTEAGREVCDATIKEVYHEMQILRDELVDEDELMLVRNYLLGSLLGDLDGPFHIINRWKSYILNGLDDKYFYSATDTIRHITPARLKELANKYLQPDYFFELVVI
ncbi:MAG: pitrilysin family protein [Bacteroidota bacterium]